MKNLLRWSETIATVKMCFNESEKTLKKLLTDSKINKNGIGGNYQRMYIRRIIANLRRQARKADEMTKKYLSDEALEKYFSKEQKPTKEEKNQYEKKDSPAFGQGQSGD